VEDLVRIPSLRVAVLGASQIKARVVVVAQMMATIAVLVSQAREDSQVARQIKAREANLAETTLARAANPKEARPKPATEPPPLYRPTRPPSATPPSDVSPPTRPPLLHRAKNGNGISPPLMANVPTDIIHEEVPCMTLRMSVAMQAMMMNVAFAMSVWRLHPKLLQNQLPSLRLHRLRHASMIASGGSTTRSVATTPMTMVAMLAILTLCKNAATMSLDGINLVPMKICVTP